VTGDGTGAFGVANNGENTDSNINLEDVTIEVSGAGSVGVYLPAMQSDTNTTGDIITGSTIKSAGTAVEVRAGKLTINEGTYLEATGTGDASITLANGGGTTTQNAALAVIQHTTKKPITVTINGGTFKGIAALLEADPQNNGTDSTNQINITVNAGTFNGAVYSADKRIFIKGGTFAGTSFGNIAKEEKTSGSKTTYNYTFSNVTEKKLLDSDYRYLDSAYTYVKEFTSDNDGSVTTQYKAVLSSDVEAPEYLVDGDDNVEIRAIASHFIFQVGDEYGFTDWSKAVAKANGQEIKLINDVTDKGSIAVSNGTVTLDLNGHKLTNSTAESAIVNVSGGQLTIKDSTDENGIIENSVSGNPAISVSGGKLIVESGTIKSSTASAIEMTAGDLAVSGGTISGETYAVKAGDDATISSITGGFLQGAIETKNTGFITSTEATFTKSFDDSFAMTDDKKTYGCVVKDTRYFGLGEIAVVSDKSEVTQAAGDAEAKVKSGSELSKDTDNKSKVLSAAEKTTVTGLENASKSNDNVADIENFLKSDKVKDLNSENINVVEVVYPVIEATSLNLDDSGDKVKSLGVEITAMVQLYATTGNAATEDALKQAVSDGTAVKADQATKLDTTGKVVEVTVPVSKDLGLISENTKNNVWIKHEVGGDSSNVRYYKAFVTTEGDNYNVTFSNPDGFSPFTIMVTTLGNVTINDISYDASDVGYTSLPDVGTNNIEGYEVYIANAYKGVFSTFTDELYQMLLAAKPETVSFVAKTKSTGTSNTGTKTEGSNNKTNGDSTSGTTDAAVDANAAQTVDAAAGNASDTNIVSNTGTGNASNNAANGTRRTTQKQNETNADAEEVVEEEQQAAQPEESVVTEEVAQVEGGDLNADAADGGVIAETVGNSSSAWIWLIAVLACAAAAILLIVVFKRRKDENA
jgi:hypothetical protein